MDFYKSVFFSVFLKVGEPKYFMTSDKRKGQRCEVKLYDETETSFPIIW